MHAIFVVSEIDPSRSAEADDLLHKIVAPQVKAAPGLVGATWGRSADGTEGRSVAIFETEEQAQAMASMVGAIPPEAPVAPKQVSVLEVVLQL